jgi:prepilin-type N-terminal cleavage/methylation domain-containing protein
MADVAREEGFTLIEVVVCVALMVAACVAGLGVLPTLAHASQDDVLRDAATTIARTAIDRARAVAAYYPAAGYQPNHAYAFNPTSTYTAAAHVHRAFCGGSGTTTDVAMIVQLAYDATTDTVTANVQYPRSPCDPTTTRNVNINAQLMPSLLQPGTAITTTIGDPTQQ